VADYSPTTTLSEYKESAVFFLPVFELARDEEDLRLDLFAVIPNISASFECILVSWVEWQSKEMI
jgi:hypothetical protein